MNLAKVNTAKTILIGPVLDADGVAVTGLTASSFKVTKNGTVGALNGSSTVTHDHTGHYLYAANAGDLDTLGVATISINSTTNGMAPISLQIVTANIYDTFCSTDKLEVDLLQIVGDVQSATDLKDFADAGYDPGTNKIQGVVLTDTITTYTGNTVQTGDSFARIGGTGSGLTSLAQASVCTETRLSELDAGTAGKMANQVDEIRTDTEDIQVKIGTPLDVGNGIATLAGNLSDIDEEVDDIHIVVNGIAITGSALNKEASSFVEIVNGTNTGAYTDTAIANGVLHTTQADASGDIDCYYQFLLGTTGIPVRVNITGYLYEPTAPLTNTIDLYVYNWVSPGWELLHTSIFSGTTSTTTFITHSDSLVSRHVEAGVGTVRIRFSSLSLDTNAELRIDQILIEYAESLSTNVALILEDTGTTLDTLIKDIPTNAEFAAGIGAVTLANGAHGGAATTITFKSITGANSDAGGSVISLTGSGTGNSHGIVINSTNGKALALGSTNSDAMSIDSAAAKGLVINGATADIDSNISGTLTTVTNLTNAPTNGDLTATMKASVNSEVDTALNTALPVAGSTVADSFADYIRRMKYEIVNKKEITEATGANVTYADDDVTAFSTVAAAYTTDSTTTIRKRLE